MPYDLLTIGHSNLRAERFMALLTSAGVTAIGDVRSVPFSRWCPWFSGKALAERLAGERIAYVALGDTLGGRPSDPKLYRDGVADYEAMAARPEFAAGLARVMDASARQRVCLLCAEREPLDCHRCLLVERSANAGSRLVTFAPTARSNLTPRRKSACSRSVGARSIFSAIGPSVSPRPIAAARRRWERV